MHTYIEDLVAEHGKMNWSETMNAVKKYETMERQRKRYGQDCMEKGNSLLGGVGAAESNDGCVDEDIRH